MRYVSLALVLLASSAAAVEPRDPHEVTSYPVVWSVPGAERVVPRAGIRYGDGDLAMSLYLPPERLGPVPVVVFANVTGIDFDTWEIYRSWGRLVAAHGMAGVVYRGGRDAGAKKSLDAILAWLAAKGPDYGVDAARVGIWACSANVSLALPWLMDGAPANVKTAILYYGGTSVPNLRKDLPLLYVLAGRDAPPLNETIRGLFTRAVAEGAPWTMVVAPRLTHAFDALDEGSESKNLVRETVAFLADRLVAPLPPGPPPSPARAALTHVLGRELPEAVAAYRALLAADSKDAAARRALNRLLYNAACAEALAGKRDDAFAHLSQAVAEGFGPREFIEKDADLTSLHDDGRWSEVLSRVK